MTALIPRSELELDGWMAFGKQRVRNPSPLFVRQAELVRGYGGSPAFMHLVEIKAGFGLLAERR